MSSDSTFKDETGSSIPKVVLRLSRHVNLSDNNEIIGRVIESDFYKKEKNAKLDQITLMINPELKDKFEKKRNEFQARNIPNRSVIVYHGTNPQNIGSIFQNNFDAAKLKRCAYGSGFYFSEFPHLALQYSSDMKTVICSEVLTGREYSGHSKSWPLHESKVLNCDEFGYAQFVIITDCDQILPLGTIEFSAIVTSRTLYATQPPIMVHPPPPSLPPIMVPPPPFPVPTFYTSSGQPQYFMRPFLPNPSTVSGGRVRPSISNQKVPVPNKVADQQTTAGAKTNSNGKK